jgi:hypothetical protein
MQAMLDAVWDYLLPAFGPAALAYERPADAGLRERLSRLELPQVPGGNGPTAFRGAEFTPRGGTCADQPTLTAVSVTEAGDDGGYVLRLTEGNASLDLRCVVGRWTVSEPGAPVPAAVSVGWTGKDAVTFDVAFLETPHHLVVTCSLPDRTFAARWRTKSPNDGPLRLFQAPRLPVRVEERRR